MGKLRTSTATLALSGTLVLIAVGSAVVLSRADGFGGDRAVKRASGRHADRHMMGRMRDAGFPPAMSPRDLPDPDGQGAPLLIRFCTQCHGLPGPGLHTADDWPVVVSRMVARMGEMPRRGRGPGMMRRHMEHVQTPNPEESDAIVDYLRRHAFRAMPPSSEESANSDLAVFHDRCSRCHAVPDPSLHPAEDWPLVVERMGRNMRRMNQVELSDQERAAIVRYLQASAR